MGLTHLDAGVIIAFLDADDVHHDAARSAIAGALENAERLSIAASALAECLVGSARRSPRAVEVVMSLLERLPVSVVDLDAGIAVRAAALRSRHRSLKLPDALVLATAEQSDADRLITTDRQWPTARALKLTVSIQQI